MTQVQIAISDSAYAREIAHLLNDGEHDVQVVTAPSLAADGVILADESAFRALAPGCKDVERCLVLKGSGSPKELWAAGVRHLAFRSDPPAITGLAVLGTELRLMATLGKNPPLGTTLQGRPVHIDRANCPPS